MSFVFSNFCYEDWIPGHRYRKLTGSLKPKKNIKPFSRAVIESLLFGASHPQQATISSDRWGGYDLLSQLDSLGARGSELLSQSEPFIQPSVGMLPAYHAWG